MIRQSLAPLLCLALLASCGGAPPEGEADNGADPAAETAAPREIVLPPRKPSPEEARVWIVSPAEGEEVVSPFVVVFGLEGMDLSPAGVHGEHTGHHHLLVDTGLPRMDLPITTDDSHIHFGNAQTGVELSLEPGTHTIRLLLADDLHIPHDPPVMSEAVTIMVTN